MKEIYNRIGLILQIIEDFKYTSYLEIGCRQDSTFSKIPITKVGVDPVLGGTVRKTSDEYFSSLAADVTFDIIFIDGLHVAEQVTRDIENSLKHLNAGGTIVVHDAHPVKEEHPFQKPVVSTWTGDVWKALVNIRQDLNLDLRTADINFGCAVIKVRKNTDPIKLDKPYTQLTWKEFVDNSQRWLRFCTPEDIMQWLKE